MMSLNYKLILRMKLIVFMVIKPAFLFTKDGSIRHFGLGKRNSTIIPIWLFVIILAIMIYMMVLSILR